MSLFHLISPHDILSLIHSESTILSEPSVSSDGVGISGSPGSVDDVTPPRGGNYASRLQGKNESDTK